MGKEKAGPLTPKGIANRIKAKGLQKLRWYCQMCQKQCRDENGFKCHVASESHQRQLLLVAENPGQYISTFSQEFKTTFLQVLKRRFGTKRVKANAVYQEYIGDRHHLHMNATQWTTLTGFVKYLGKQGLCKVDETERGWFIEYIDRDPETLRRQEMHRKKEKMSEDDTDIVAKMIKKQIEIEQTKSQNLQQNSITNQNVNTVDNQTALLAPLEAQKLDRVVAFKLSNSSTNPTTEKQPESCIKPDVFINSILKNTEQKPETQKYFEIPHVNDKKRKADNRDVDSKSADELLNKMVPINEYDNVSILSKETKILDSNNNTKNTAVNKKKFRSKYRWILPGFIVKFKPYDFEGMIPINETKDIKRPQKPFKATVLDISDLSSSNDKSKSAIIGILNSKHNIINDRENIIYFYLTKIEVETKNGGKNGDAKLDKTWIELIEPYDGPLVKEAGVRVLTSQELSTKWPFYSAETVIPNFGRNVYILSGAHKFKCAILLDLCQHDPLIARIALSCEADTRKHNNLELEISIDDICKIDESFLELFQQT